MSRIAYCLAVLGPGTTGCSGNEEPPPTSVVSTGGTASGVGGSTIAASTSPAASGGTAAVSTPNAGGAPVSSGGTSSVGTSSDAVPAVGGATSGVGGQGSGGVATSSGGTSTAAGGKASGGTSTAAGGKAAGGTSTTAGGQATGGSSSAGDVVKSAGCGKTTTLKGETTRTISVSGTNRTYILRLPDNYDPNHAYRLITSIHCLNGTASGVASGSAGTNYQYYGLWKLSAGTTIFAAPQGINNSWPGGAGDEGFLKALVTELKNTLCIDETRVFSEGFSMGGSMSYALACAFSDIFRGVAVHSGGPMSGCNKSNRKPVAYFMTHGTKDSVCTYPNYGVPQINDFAQVNGCQTMDIPGTLKPTDTSGKTPVCADYQGCTAGHPARACIFVGDHTPSPGGEANTWVPAETWKFITQF